MPEDFARNDSAEILLVYRTGGILAIDQRNIALLARVVAKATRPISAEIFYHLPARLSDWTQPANGVRYTRLKNAGEWPLAERIARQANTTVIVFDASLLIAAQDVWHLVGYAQQHAQVLLMPRRVARNPHEPLSGFAMREARLHLQRTVWNRVTDASAMAVLSPRESARSVRAQITYAEILKQGAEADLFAFYGNSRAVSARQSVRWLATTSRTIAAYRHWKAHGAFASAYSQKTPVFHVAQIAVYAATLLCLAAPAAGAIVFAFAVAITPTYFLTNLNLLNPLQTARRLAARFCLYFVG
ncbi:hypothetical protein [Turneriella parva]|uniref:Uncharacterized protein n=1 Tax=Turneriella parva (strain ATCC BAA-1111 / DSM 21527 / NCTC 11395 / H) TaxID=869212 RepID=I4B7W2_TURPD|nr:hypothetical protein [Turneriella parva]AFM13369.1 hypothetical protein Turpa_2730 [Turneriella parva DSM 21527]